MGFDLRDDGFHIVLSKDVPQLIRGEIAAVAGRLLARTGVARDSIDAWILHPGGRKVLVNIEEELGLPRAATQPSWDVLRDYGNLSSATVLFVLHEWLARPRPAGGHGLLGAFGPGFSAELVLLRWN
jgi:alkylresorcinol/alkylpyrone synthase